MIKVNFDFREKLNSIIGAEFHCFCFQCGACVGDCPAARYSEKFNPRLILMSALIGNWEPLIEKNSIIWECTNCYNCYERCPQDVRPVEVLMALKNMATAVGNNPELSDQMVESIRKTGRTAVITDTTHRRREEFGLAPLEDVPISEVQALLDIDKENK